DRAARSRVVDAAAALLGRALRLVLRRVRRAGPPGGGGDHPAGHRRSAPAPGRVLDGGAGVLRVVVGPAPPGRGSLAGLHRRPGVVQAAVAGALGPADPLGAVPAPSLADAPHG